MSERCSLILCFLKIYSHEIDTTGMTVDEIKDEVIRYLYRDVKKKGKQK